MEITQIKGLVDTICRLVVHVTVAQAEALCEEIDRTDALLPVVDPTAWLDISGTLPAHQKVARAFLTFRRVLDEVSNEAQ